MAKNTFSAKEFKTKCYFPTLFSMANLMISLMIQHNQNKVSQHGGISSRLCRTREPWVQAIISHWGQSECFPTCSLTQLRQMNIVSNFHKEYVQPSLQSGHLTVPSFLSTHSCFFSGLVSSFRKKKSKQLEDFQSNLVSGLLLYHLWFCAFQTINNTFFSKKLSVKLHRSFSSHPSHLRN